MIRYTIPLLLLIIVSSETLSQTTLQQRIATADPLLISDDNSPIFMLVRDTAAEARRAQQNLRYVATARINFEGLLQGYSQDLKLPGKPYWTSQDMLQMVFFDGELVFLKNLRIYNIKSNVIGWIGSVLNHQGTKIGSVRFEIYDQNKVHGHFFIPKRFRLEIEPIEGIDRHDVMEFGHPSVVNLLFDSPDTRTATEIAADDKMWQEQTLSRG